MNNHKAALARAIAMRNIKHEDTENFSPTVDTDIFRFLLNYII